MVISFYPASAGFFICKKTTNLILNSQFNNKKLTIVDELLLRNQSKQQMFCKINSEIVTCERFLPPRPLA